MFDGEKFKHIKQHQPAMQGSFESQLAPSVNLSRSRGPSPGESMEEPRIRTASISHDVPSPGTSSELRAWTARNSHAKRHCSDAFQHLLDRLLQQHLLELCEGSSGSHTGLTTAGRNTDRSSKRDSACSFGESISQAKTLTENHRRRQIQEMHEVHASEILSAWDRREPEKEDDLSITPSVRSEQGEGSNVPTAQVLRDDPIHFSESLKMDLLITGLVGLNVLWMAVQLQFHSHKVACDISMNCQLWIVESWDLCQQIFLIGDGIFAFIFALDVTVRLIVLRRTFWLRWMNFVDLIVSITCLVEIIVVVFTTSGSNLEILRILRFARLARALRVVALSAHLASFQLLIKCLIACKGMLVWSFVLLAFVQCVAGLILSSLCWAYIEDTNRDEAKRQQVFMYYGSFTRTSLSMFEILFANWAPACRVLVENVSEWFSIFFLFYRCVLGFAILNVVNAVFVQQTMKTASSDEELAFRQKERDVVSYNRKVRRLFQSIDASGDGAITLEEFEKLVSSPKLRFWMSQLELEYHDLLSLFEFLDNGDGVITLTEFIEGAARLRGQAKALDVWRMETKVEILFEEVLSALKVQGFAMAGSSYADSETSQEIARGTSVHDVFQNSNWRHIKPTSQISQVSDASGASGASDDFS